MEEIQKNVSQHKSQDFEYLIIKDTAENQSWIPVICGLSNFTGLRSVMEIIAWARKLLESFFVNMIQKRFVFFGS